jgi:hypothetical protein
MIKENRGNNYPNLYLKEIFINLCSCQWGSSLSDPLLISMDGNLLAQMSAKSPSNISPNLLKVISEVSEP